MSLVLKNWTYEPPEEALDENLEPVSDEEFKEIYKEILDDFDRAYEEAPEPELDAELLKILETEDFMERTRLYEQYCQKRGKSIACE